MTPSATFAVMAMTLAVCVTALCHWLSDAPGWRDVRVFSYVALTAALYCALSVPLNLGMAGPVVIWCARAKLLVVAMHVLAWERYASDHLRLTRRPWERWYACALLAAGATALVPGLVYSDTLQARAFAPLRLAYAQPVPTAWGRIVYAGLLSAFAVVIVRYWRAWRRGEPYAALHCAGLATLLLLGVNDALAVSTTVALPHVVELGCAAPLAAVAYSLVARFAADTRDLARLRVELESLVEERTRELACAVDALHRSEKLAAMGQLAAGVAHEVNNPVAVVAGNLQLLAAATRRVPALPRDAASCVADSLTAVGRISHVARQLLAAGRLAATAGPCQSVSVEHAVEEAVRAARARCGAHVRFDSNIPAGLSVLAQEDAFVQVLANLLTNACQAIPEDRRDGRVSVRADGGPKVRIVVEDNGVGMGADTLARAFEPFFTTKRFGSGTGLGLAVSRGLVEGLGGELRLESELGSGTRAIVELPAGDRERVPRSSSAAAIAAREVPRGRVVAT